MSEVLDDAFPVMRTLGELKAEAQARADRNAYPLAGLKPDEVREALARIDSLDRDVWATAWSAIADRYAAAGEHLTAWRYYSFARWPVPLSPRKHEAYRKGLAAFRAAATGFDPPLEIVRIPFDGREIVGCLRLPAARTGPAPVVIAIGGLDSRKEDLIERFAALLPDGIGTFGLDMPGTGEAPVAMSAGAERMFSAAIDALAMRPEIDARRILVYGGSFGGHWAIRLAVRERDRLCGVVAQSGPVHAAFQPNFLKTAFVTKEYLFDRGPAIASMYDGVTTPSALLAAAPRMSLVEQGYIGPPTVEPMLVIGGEHDTQVPVADIDLLLHSGSPKHAWINPNGGHMGREAAGWTDPVIFAKITAPWIRGAVAAAGEGR